MGEEKRLILEMLNKGKVTLDEAEKLLALQGDEISEAPAAKSINKKFLKILVTEEDHTKVNINFPIALAEVGIKLIPKDVLKIEEREINLNEILHLIKEGVEGELVNVTAMDHGKEVKVKIFVE